MNLSLKLLKNRPDPKVKNAAEATEIRNLRNGEDFRYIRQKDLQAGWSEGVLTMENEKAKSGTKKGGNGYRSVSCAGA